jgi:hypothetical protein
MTRKLSEPAVVSCNPARTKTSRSNHRPDTIMAWKLALSGANLAGIASAWHPLASVVVF